MTMQALNFIPFGRLENRRRKVLRRRWIVGCTAYAGLVVLAGAAALAVDTQTSSGVQARLQATSQEVDRVAADVAVVRTDFDRANALLRSSRAIAEQPDWSSLMALLASKAGGEVILKGCAVRPLQPPTMTNVRAGPQAKPAKPQPVDPTLLVNISGLSSSQTAVSQFALRLEATGLFGRVSLLDTTREPFAGKQLVAFRIECTLADPTSPKPTAVAGGAALTGGGR